VSGTFSSQRSAGYAGLYVSPLVPSLCVAWEGPALQPIHVVTIVERCALVYPVSLVVGSLVGLPIFFILSLLRLTDWWAIVLSGFLVGALLVTIIGLLGGGFLLSEISISGLEGAGSALVFWLYWRMGPTPNAQSARIWVCGIVSRR
jgi:hypothetical protein